MNSKKRVVPTGAPISNARWLALVGFVLVVALTGGGARSDIISLPLLRAAAIVFAVFTLATAPRGVWREGRVPLILLTFLAAWMAVQLLPLPTDFWSTLPLRDNVYAIDKLLGEGDRWRPISLAPWLTLNSLFALTVPAAALIVALATPAGEKMRLWWAIWSFGILSSLFGLLQLISGPRSIFYLYRITNEGALVGIFSNRNHFALLLSFAILAAGALISNELFRRNSRSALIAALASTIVMFVLLILAIGSRLGLICGMISLGATFAITRWSASRRPRPVNQSRKMQANAGASWSSRATRVALNLAPIVALVSVGALFYLSDRANSIVRLVDGSGAPEMRIAALGTVSDLLRGQWLWGSGFGSFAKVFQIVEPDSLLQPSYFNQAHNDWLQLPIEGGLPAMLIGVAALAWIVALFVSLVRRYRAPAGPVLAEAAFLMVAFICIAIGSLVDYPLRTPSLAMVAALLVILLLRCGSARSMERASVM